MPFGFLRFTRSLRTALVLSSLTGCSGFIQPTAVTVTYEEKPSTSKPAREGYLRIWTTTNFAGLYTSWKDDSSRARFKKLLVTIEVAGSGREIPVLSLDITGQQPEATNLIDEDFGRLAYVKLDSDDGSGTSTPPKMLLTVRGVPETAAAYIDQVVAASTRLLRETPLGTSLAAIVPPGTDDIIRGVLNIARQQAAEYKDKKWSRQMSASIDSQVGLPHGQAVWILIPDDAPLAAGARDQPVDASQADSTPRPPQIPTNLSACTQTGDKAGKLTHVCVLDRDGKAQVYDRYAWVSMRFELRSEPGADLIPEVNCGRLKDPTTVAADVSLMDAYTLSPKHRQEVDSYIGAYQAAHAILTRDGVSQFAAFTRWIAYDGEHLLEDKANPAPTPPKAATWSAVNARRASLKQCLLPALKSSPGVGLRYLDAAKLNRLAAGDATTPEHLYAVVSALDLVLEGEPPETADADFGQLRRQRTHFERRLYAEVFELAKTRADLDRALGNYPRCEHCVARGQKKRDSLAIGPRSTPVEEAPTIDASLEALNIDPAPLAKARSSIAKLMTLESAKASPQALESARTAWKNDATAAEKFLIEEVNVSPAAAAAFVQYE